MLPAIRPYSVGSFLSSIQKIRKLSEVLVGRREDQIRRRCVYHFGSLPCLIEQWINFVNSRLILTKGAYGNGKLRQKRHRLDF